MTRPSRTKTQNILVFCCSLVAFCTAATGNSATAAQDNASNIGLIEAEAPRAPFWEGQFPRTAALLQDARLNAVCSIGPVVWAVGERGVVVTSEDHGQTWRSRAVPFPCRLTGVTFLTNHFGWICGTRIDSVTTESRAVLLATRDGGEHWTDLTLLSQTHDELAALVPAHRLTDILHTQFFGQKSGLAIASRRSSARPVLMRTEDGGITWAPVPTDQSSSAWRTAQFINPHEGIVAGEGLAFGTYVADRIVTLSPDSGPGRCVNDVSLETTGSGWMCGDGGLLMQTTDGGVSWSAIGNALSSRLSYAFDLHTVCHRRGTVLCAGSPGSTVLRSEDGGQNWELIPLPGSLPVSRMCFLNDQTVVAVGSCGTIYRSVDAGRTWTATRNARHRCGVLHLVTDVTDSAGGMLAATAGDRGIRTTVVQLSVDTPGPQQQPRLEAVRAQQMVGSLGGDSFTTDWRFRRDAPEQHLTPDALLSAWNRATDGRLREALPERLAAIIRTWRPSVIVLEPAVPEDAVMQLIQAALPTALSLASDTTNGSSVLNELHLAPHTVQRFLRRAAPEQSTILSFRHSDLLPNAGTTIGLATQLSRKVNQIGERQVAVGSDAVFFEPIPGSPTTVTPAGIVDGMGGAIGFDARRPEEQFSMALRSDLEKIAQQAQTEAAALQGNAMLTGANHSIIAYVTEVGSQLPDAMALQQLRYLAELNHQHQNFEGWLAVLQEITRRFPQSADSLIAAEQLFQYYSSGELRFLRIRTMQEQESSQARIPGLRNADANALDQLLHPERLPQITGSPKVEPAAGVKFGEGSRQLPVLLEAWNRKAAFSLSLLTANLTPADLSPQVLLRQAANLRRDGRTGDQATLLGQLSERRSLESDYAQAEMQAAFAASTPALPVINVPPATESPWLDAGLSDTCWERAKEVRLADTSDSLNSPYGDALIFVSYDEEYLYVSGRLEHTTAAHSDIPLALDRSYDSDHGTHDRIEISLDTDRDYATSFTFRVDQTGRTSESCWEMTSWDPEWFAAVDSDAATWRFELAIPMRELALRPAKPGDLWAVSLRRICPGVLRQTIVEPDQRVTRDDGQFLVRFIRNRR